MRVRCVAKAPTKAQILRLGPGFERTKSDYDLVPGREYLVLGFGHSNGVAWIEVASDGGWPQTVPLFLFELLDARPSRFWEVRHGTDESLAVLPAPFHDPTFASRVADGDDDALAEYAKWRSLIETESRRAE